MHRGRPIPNDSDVLLANAKLSEKTITDAWLRLKITNVRKLDLSSNYLAKLYKEVGSRVICLFEGFTNLEELNLSNNPLEHIHPHNFHSTPALRVLLLENSSLGKDLNLRFLKNLRALQHLSLKGHRIHSLTHANFSKLV